MNAAGTAGTTATMGHLSTPTDDQPMAVPAGSTANNPIDTMAVDISGGGIGGWFTAGQTRDTDRSVCNLSAPAIL